MAADYTINYSDGASLTIPANTVEDSSTSLKLPGRYTTDYGKHISENFLRLLENFAHSNAPANPTEGQLWYNNTAGVDQLKIYDGTQWVPAGGIHKATTQPLAGSSVTGDLWVDTDNQQLYLFTGSGWVLVGPEFSQGLSTGTKPTTIVGTDNLEYTVVLIQVEAKPVAIISTKTFTPKSNIAGFTTIQPGFNLSSVDITGSGIGKFYGTAEKAEKLISGGDIVSGSNFLRKDVANVANFGLKINNNSGIDVGNSATLNIGIEGQAGIISHKTSGANIDFRVNDQGTTRTVMRIDSTTNVGINTTAPTEALDVTGNIQASGELYINSTTQSDSISTGSIITAGGLGVAKQLYVGEDAVFESDITTGNIMPNANISYDIGSSTNRFLNVYATNLYGNFVGTLTGSISGAAETANKLSSATRFSLVGDVTSNEIVFDGQDDDPAVFTTSISNAFVSGKTATSFSQNSDEILINRVSGSTGLYKISRDNFFSAIAKIPTGMITPFGGAAAPNFWLLCDGSEYERSLYPQLFAVIGTSFGTPSSATKFKMPDLRGRMPLGRDNMGGTSADRVTASAADNIGGFGGNETKTIPVENLPQHTHKMQGVTGAQYYALRDGGVNPGETTAIVYDAPTGTGAGSAIANSGDVDSGAIGNAQDVMNPYLTINYIIFTGQSE